MEGLQIDAIPSFLLARILMQLHSIPPGDNPDLINILTAGLRQYGTTSDVNAFLDYCCTLAQKDLPWVWSYYEINNDMDWNLANHKKPQEIVGMRFLLASETARRNVQLIRYGRNKVLDPKCYHIYQDSILPVDQLLYDTLDYFKQEKSGVDSLVEELIELRLEQFARDKFLFQQESNALDNTTYQLMGALMARYDSTASNGSLSNCWCLYLRDYVESDGNLWRIIVNDTEHTVPSEQALADIRGTCYESILPSEFSKEYRPIYLFYINQDKLLSSPAEEHITLDDYTFDEEDEYLDDTQPSNIEEDESCMHCGIKDIVNDINDIFFCENCNKGVHQLCEKPAVQAFEKNIDPWFCRTCCAFKNIPIPVASQSLLSVLQPSPPIKRKREEDNIEE
ncbi:hypothetical protein EDC94DRAFT_619537 [Helicostylum pulchrum]|nr:hypothetical protein EDC94DRAFT_619537 [Helicostylum pulchrum]